MKSGTCPKCQSRDVFMAVNNRGAYGMNTIPTKRGVVGLDNYVCGSCGYIEFYVTDGKGRKKIASRWKRA